MARFCQAWSRHGPRTVLRKFRLTDGEDWSIFAETATNGGSDPMFSTHAPIRQTAQNRALPPPADFPASGVSPECGNSADFVRSGVSHRRFQPRALRLRRTRSGLSGAGLPRSRHSGPNCPFAVSTVRLTPEASGQASLNSGAVSRLATAAILPARSGFRRDCGGFPVGASPFPAAMPGHRHPGGSRRFVAVSGQAFRSSPVSNAPQGALQRLQQGVPQGFPRSMRGLLSAATASSTASGPSARSGFRLAASACIAASGARAAGVPVR